MKDYDLTILYHPGKANMVADPFSRKDSGIGSLAAIQVEDRPLAKDVQRLANGLVRLQISDDGGVLACVKAHSSLMV